MRILSLLLFLAVATVGLAPRAHAAEALESKWNDFGARFQFGVSARYGWFAASDADPTPATPHEFLAGPVAAYELTRHLSLSAQLMYGLDSKVTGTQLGLTWAIIGGSQ